MFLRFVTEHPTGTTFFDLDILPKSGVDLCTLMRICIVDKSKAGAMRNEIASLPQEKLTGTEFQNFTKRWKNK